MYSVYWAKSSNNDPVSTWSGDHLDLQTFRRYKFGLEIQVSATRVLQAQTTQRLNIWNDRFGTGVELSSLLAKEVRLDWGIFLGTHVT